MSTIIRAPYGRTQVTSVWPDPEFQDGRAAESNIQIKRKMLGDVVLYKKSSDRRELNLQFIVSRLKDLEIAQILQAFHTHEWQIDLYDGSIWRAKLVGEPVRRQAVSRRDANNSSTGDEDFNIAFRFSAIRTN